jgi:hypothetical protein
MHSPTGRLLTLEVTAFEPQVRANSAARNAIFGFELLSRPADIKNLAQSTSGLIAENGASFNPDFFLASLWEHWAPRVVVIRQGSEITGIVCAKARKVLGIPTGIVYIDSGLSSSIFARNGGTVDVLIKACGTLLDRMWIRGLRLTVSADSCEAAAVRDHVLSWGLDCDETDVSRHRVLPLPATFDAFMSSIGLKTRRHIRYYRRRVEADGHAYVETLSLAEFEKAGADLIREDIVGADPDMLRRAVNVAATANTPLLAGLRAKNGDWLSLLAGWYEGDRAFVFLQINSDKRHANYSPSVVLRSYLIESLITKGTKELVFWGSLEGRLKPHTVPASTVYMYIDKSDLLWRTFRGIVRHLDRKLPERLTDSFRWIVRHA